jgi:hypothetical protein
MAYLRWKELDKIRYAAVVEPVTKNGRTREVILVSLGQRPRLTSEVMWRVGYRYPSIKVDWGRIYLDLMADKAELTYHERVRIHYFKSIPTEERERLERALALFRFKNKARAPRLDHPILVEWRRRLEMSSFERIDRYLTMTAPAKDGYFRDFYTDYARYLNATPRRKRSITLPVPVPTPWHAILGLRGDEDAAAIKRRYRHLAKIYHPDVNRESTGDGDGHKMREINTACKELLSLVRDGFRVPVGKG